MVLIRVSYVRGVIEPRTKLLTSEVATITSFQLGTKGKPQMYVPYMTSWLSLPVSTPIAIKYSLRQLNNDQHVCYTQ